MTLPTRDQLHDEVDRQFFAANPGAPARLDPDDPSHAALVSDWLQRRDDVLHAWVDDVFQRFFPHAGKLDPADPADADLIAYWCEIRDAIRDGTPPRHNWDADPTPTDETSATPDASTPDTSPTPAPAPGPTASEYEDLARALRADLRSLLELNRAPTENDATRHLDNWLDIGRSMYLGNHFASHDEWTSPTENFDDGPYFTDFGVQIRVVGADRSLRMGMVGTGPSSVGGWERYNGAPTQ